MLMKALALLVAVVLALGASGYASKQQTICGRGADGGLIGTVIALKSPQV
jgi:hypothetical protein